MTSQNLVEIVLSTIAVASAAVAFLRYIVVSLFKSNAKTIELLIQQQASMNNSVVETQRHIASVLDNHLTEIAKTQGALIENARLTIEGQKGYTDVLVRLSETVGQMQRTQEKMYDKQVQRHGEVR